MKESKILRLSDFRCGDSQHGKRDADAQISVEKDRRQEYEKVSAFVLPGYVQNHGIPSDNVRRV